jgi:hypothetical protein
MASMRATFAIGASSGARDLPRSEQIELVRRVIAFIAGRDLVNHVVRIAEDGSTSIEPMPG